MLKIIFVKVSALIATRKSENLKFKQPIFVHEF